MSKTCTFTATAMDRPELFARYLERECPPSLAKVMAKVLVEFRRETTT